MGDEKHCDGGFVVDLQQRIMHRRARNRVHSAKRLVEQKHRRFHDQRTQNLDAPLYAAGQLARVAVSYIAEPDLLQAPTRDARRVAAAEPPLRDQAVADVVGDGEPREERAVLEDDDPVGTDPGGRPARAAQQLPVQVDPT